MTAGAQIHALSANPLSRLNLMGTDFSPLMAHKSETVWFERYTGHRGGWPSIIVRAGSSDLCWSIPSKIEIDPANKAAPLCFHCHLDGTKRSPSIDGFPRNLRSAHHEG